VLRTLSVWRWRTLRVLNVSLRSTATPIGSTDPPRRVSLLPLQRRAECPMPAYIGVGPTHSWRSAVPLLTASYEVCRR
jgi:hypothetical protein